MAMTEKKRITLYVDKTLLDKLDAKIKTEGESRVDYFDAVLRRNLMSRKERAADIEDFMKITAARLKSVDSQQTIIIEMLFRIQRYLFDTMNPETAKRLTVEFSDELANSLITDTTFLSILENLTAHKIEREEKLQG